MPAGRKPKDLSMLQGESIKPFIAALRSPATSEVYRRRLATFLEHVRMDVDTFVTRSKKNPEWAQELILKYLLNEKERAARGEIVAGTVGNVKKPVKLLLEMNDVTGINWKKISRMLPSVRLYALDRAPTVEELRLLISNAETRFQAILLVMASSGIRIGAWDYLNWGDVKPIEKDGKLAAAKLTVYHGEPEEYFTFITPEAYAKLKQYIELRESHGEKITRESPLIRDRWQPNPRGSPTGIVDAPKRLQSRGVKRLFESMLWKFGLRKEKKRRHEFSIHSIRKFFKTRCEQMMKPINVETLMGHSTGISDSYYRPTEKELLEDYLKAVPLLTLSEAEEVRRVSELSRSQLEGRLQQLEDLVSRLAAEKGQQVLAQGQSRTEGTSNSNTSKKVVKAEEIDKCLEEGWEPVMTLPDGRILVKTAT